jgi:hypothetical protein
MAEDAEENPGRPEELKTRGGSLSSEGANAAAKAERSTSIKLMRSLQQSNALISNAITTLNVSSRLNLDTTAWLCCIQIKPTQELSKGPAYSATPRNSPDLIAK